MTPFVIAEMGLAHGGSLERALALVDAVARGGANAVKTAYWSSTAAMRKRMHSEDDPVDLHPLRAREEWLAILRDAAKSKRLEFLCTVDCPEDIPVVAPYVDRFKIASWGAMDRDFIAAHRKYCKPLIVSYGTCDLWEFNAARLYVNNRTAGDWLLHCVSAYPAPLSEINLKVISKEGFDGFSDHTGKTITGALAVAAGARVLEVHVRAADTPQDNPDFPHSLTPEDFKLYVGLAHLAARALGDGVKKCQPSEKSNRRFRYV